MGRDVTPEPFRSLEDIQANPGYTTSSETQGMGCSMSQINHSIAVEGTPIINPDNCTATIAEVCNHDLGAERQEAVGSGHGAGA